MEKYLFFFDKDNIAKWLKEQEEKVKAEIQSWEEAEKSRNAQQLDQPVAPISQPAAPNRPIAKTDSVVSTSRTTSVSELLRGIISGREKDPTHAIRKELRAFAGIIEETLADWDAHFSDTLVRLDETKDLDTTAKEAFEKARTHFYGLKNIQREALALTNNKFLQEKEFTKPMTKDTVLSFKQDAITHVIGLYQVGMTQQPKKDEAKKKLLTDVSHSLNEAVESWKSDMMLNESKLATRIETVTQIVKDEKLADLNVPTVERFNLKDWLFSCLHKLLNGVLATESQQIMNDLAKDVKKLGAAPRLVP
jgi:gas vesicle protein